METPLNTQQAQHYSAHLSLTSVQVRYRPKGRALTWSQKPSLPALGLPSTSSLQALVPCEHRGSSLWTTSTDPVRFPLPCLSSFAGVISVAWRAGI